jgi:hypothetical protein
MGSTKQWKKKTGTMFLKKIATTFNVASNPMSDLHQNSGGSKVHKFPTKT